MGAITADGTRLIGTRVLGYETRRSSVNRRIWRAAASVTAAGVVVKLVAMLKEVVVASAFGRSDAMDAFLAAFLVPNLLINVVAESMNQALIPTLIRVRILEGKARAQELLSHAMLRLCLLLAGTAGALALLARVMFPVIASNFGAAKVDLAVRLFYVLLPCVVLGGIATNCTAVLNATEQFGRPALAPALIPLATIAGTMLLAGRMGIWAVAAATVGGSALYAGSMAWAMEARGFAFRLRWGGGSEATREVAGQYGPVLLSAVVASGGLLVDQAMAAMLPAGSVSTLVFAGRFAGVAMTLLAGAVSSAVMPAFSELVALKDWEGCRTAVRTWAGRTALGAAPVALALMAGSHWLVRATLEHGAFRAADTASVAPVLAMYAIQIPFFVVSRVFYRFVVAMRRTDLVLACGLINLALDVALNVILMRRMGVAGIALSTSLWTVSTCGFLGFWAWRLLHSAEQGEK